MKHFEITPATFILLANLTLLALSFIVLGKETTKNSIIGSLVFPLYVYITTPLTNIIFDLSGTETIVIAIFRAVLAGTGFGLIFKTGYTTGGTDVIGLIFSKITKKSMGQNKFLADGLVVLSGAIVYSWEQ